jgi:hypothetical protein
MLWRVQNFTVVLSLEAIMAWKLSDWTNIIYLINNLANHAPAGCNPATPLQTLGIGPHRWSQTDITNAQKTLKQICPTNTFDPVPTKWTQKTVDQLNAAIAKGWCNCQPPYPPNWPGPRQCCLVWTWSEWVELNPTKGLPESGWWPVFAGGGAANTPAQIMSQISAWEAAVTAKYPISRFINLVVACQVPCG